MEIKSFKNFNLSIYIPISACTNTRINIPITLRKIFIICSLLIIAIIPTSILKISKEDYPQILWIKNNEVFGKIIINKINLNEDLYPINNKHNNIEEHVTILKESTMPDKDNSILIIAAHSGTGKIAYFNDLNKLDLEDEITIIYKNKKYKYIVNEIWEEKKNGYIHINKDNKKQLVLTTCSPNKENYQLIVNCIEKEST